MSVIDPEIVPAVVFSESSFPEELDRPGPSDTLKTAEEIRWGPEDFAFNQVAITFGVSEDHIDLFPPETKRFWAALVGAVTACNVTTPEGEVTVMGSAEIRDIYRLATLEGENGTRFLQQFTIETTQNGKRLKKEATTRIEAAHLNANILYGRAIQEYRGRRQAGASFAK